MLHSQHLRFSGSTARAGEVFRSPNGAHSLELLTTQQIPRGQTSESIVTPTNVCSNYKRLPMGSFQPVPPQTHASRGRHEEAPGICTKPPAGGTGRSIPGVRLDRSPARPRAPLVQRTRMTPAVRPGILSSPVMPSESTFGGEDTTFSPNKKIQGGLDRQTSGR